MTFTNIESDMTQFKHSETPSTTEFELADCIKDQITDLVNSKAEEDEYQQYCDSKLSFSQSTSSVPELKIIQSARKEIKNALSIDIDEIIENSQDFEFLIFKSLLHFDSLAIMVLDNYLELGKIKYLLAVKLLSFLGWVNHQDTLPHRTFLLTKALKNKSRYVREGARLGLLYLNNSSVIPDLDEAITKETSPRLKKKLVYTRDKLGK